MLASTPAPNPKPEAPPQAALEPQPERPISLRPGKSLIGADLRDRDLSGVDLSGADLSRADMRGCKALGVILNGAILHEARLDGAEMLGANLEGADLSNCQSARASFNQANMKGASCFGANFEHASFIQANCEGADFRGATLRDARLRDAELVDSDWTRADLQGADLAHANLAHGVFIETDLRRSRLRGAKGYASAKFLSADIRDVDFTGAYLMRRQILDENYLEEFRSRGRANAMVYWVWSVSSDCGRSALRWSAWVLGITVLYGIAFSFLNIDYGDHPTPLSPYYFSLVTLTTLGYGDVLPADGVAQGVVMTEVVVGYLMLGGLLSIFSNKMARRAE